MFDILAITGPIYFIIAIGFLLTRFGLFVKTEMRVLGKFVINLALPALLFKALAQSHVADILNVSYLLAYLIGTFALIGLGYFWSRRIASLSLTTSTVYVMGMSMSNSGFVGYPILLLTLAPVAGVSLALNMIVENLIVIPFLLLMAERARGGTGQWRVIRQSLIRLAGNPMIIGLFSGFAVSVLELQLPAVALRFTNILAAATGALSLFFIGGTLVGLPMRGLGRVMPIALGKLILHPLLVLLSTTALPMLGFAEIEPSLRMAVVLMAAMPMMGIYPILAQTYGEGDLSAVAMLVATVSSFFTISGVLFVLKDLPGFG